ncbi:Sensor protein ZraS [compost metagenome]
MTIADLTEEEQQEVKQQLLQITRDTSDMLMNILTWSKSQMGGTHIQLTTLDVNEALKKSLKIEYSLAAKKQIDLQVIPGEPLSIIADPDMFQLVIRNLVNNAIKFTGNGGLVSVTAVREGEQCCIKVQDNGLGISAGQQKKLFKLKASATYGTNKERGVGLGLLLCKEFTELQGGEIAFESKEGAGSVFSLWFKLSES